MGRAENRELYVPLKRRDENSGGQFAHRYPISLKTALLTVGAAVAAFLVLWLILVATGLRLTTIEYDNGVSYTYFGWIVRETPVAGAFSCSDGSSANIHGKRVEYLDGRLYEGELSGFLMHGQGRLCLVDGTLYVGDFENGVYSGEGSLSLPDGTRYTGEFKNGEYDGHGELHYPDGTVYIGEFSRGEKNGNGSATYSNGDRFVGRFENDMRASGVYTWRTGESIESDNFKNNMPPSDEKVIYTDSAGKSYKAYYSGGRLWGKVSYTKPTPSTPPSDNGGAVG